MKAEAITETVHKRSHDQFRFCVPASDTAHVLTAPVSRNRVHVRSFRKLLQQPAEDFPLVGDCSPPDLNEKFLERWTIQSQIPCSFIADRTNRSEVTSFVRAAHGLIFDMSDVKPRFPSRVVRMRLTSDRAAHLACETIPIKNIGNKSYMLNASLLQSESLTSSAGAELKRL